MIKVLIVDDSALIRSILKEIIDNQPNMQLVGTAIDAYMAKEMVIQFQPDVITLDIEMPKVSGLTFLEKLMKAQPTPVIMISTLTQKGAAATLRALELGAIDYLPKPQFNVTTELKQYEKLIVEKINTAAKARVKKLTVYTPHKTLSVGSVNNKTVISIGASTGGTEAIKHVLEPLPLNMPGIVMTQHMPAGFTATFARRLDSLCQIYVKEAEDREKVLPGHAYLAPGDRHLHLRKVSTGYIIRLEDGERVSGHKPSVDVMFESVSESAGKDATAVLLTGMGKDGARGMLTIRQNGGHTIAQDEASSVVFGMPKEAIKLNAANQIVSLDKISQAIVNHLK